MEKGFAFFFSPTFFMEIIHFSWIFFFAFFYHETVCHLSDIHICLHKMLHSFLTPVHQTLLFGSYYDIKLCHTNFKLLVYMHFIAFKITLVLKRLETINRKIFESELKWVIVKLCAMKQNMLSKGEKINILSSTKRKATCGKKESIRPQFHFKHQKQVLNELLISSLIEGQSRKYMKNTWQSCLN